MSVPCMPPAAATETTTAATTWCSDRDNLAPTLPRAASAQQPSPASLPSHPRCQHHAPHSSCRSSSDHPTANTACRAAPPPPSPHPATTPAVRTTQPPTPAAAGSEGCHVMRIRYNSNTNVTHTPATTEPLWTLR